MTKIIDLSGKTFGKWTVLSRGENVGNRPAYICECECGTVKTVGGNNLRRGISTSCGCSVKTDITGEKFSRLTVISLADKGGTHKSSVWTCVCECGNEIKVSKGSLKTGNTRSCGCLYEETNSTLNGMSRTPEASAWYKIIDRCYKKTNKRYKDYGKRGISVCIRWRGHKGFFNFLSDMGERPTNKHSIDRKNNNKGYSPDNCQWATNIEQANNKRNNRLLTFHGETLTIAEWSRKIGISQSAILNRLSRGWNIDRTLTAPLLM